VTDATDPATRTGFEGRLWFALLGGPAAWTAHLLASYPLVRVSCRLGSVWMLHGITILTVLIGVAATWMGWHVLQEIRNEEPGALADAPARRARFMALTGAIISGFFTVVTLVEGLPVAFGDPCLRGP
jgi:hypothetical protein